MTTIALDNLIAIQNKIMADVVKDAYLEALNSCGIYGMPALDKWEGSVACAFCDDIMRNVR